MPHGVASHRVEQHHGAASAELCDRLLIGALRLRCPRTEIAGRKVTHDHLLRVGVRIGAQLVDDGPGGPRRDITGVCSGQERLRV